MASKRAVFGIIAILLSAGTLYLTLGSDAILKVDSTKTTYYINESGTLINTGVEYVCIKETPSGVCVIKKYKPFVNYSINETTLLATRETEYVDGSKIVQTYYFDKTKQSIYDFPIKQDIRVIGASGKYLEYKANNLYPLDNKNKFLLYDEYALFGKNMRVSFQQQDLLSIKSTGTSKITFTLLYNITSNDAMYNARLYDPPVVNGTVGLSINGTGLNLTAELGTNITINATNSGGIVCVDINHHDYGVNYSCANNSVIVGFVPQDFKTNTAWGTNTSFNITYNTTGNYSVNISAHAFDDVTSNMTFSLRGYSFNGSLPSGVVVYLGDTLLYNIGRLDTEITAMNGSVNNTVHNFSSTSTITIGYIRLPALANVTNGRMSFYAGYGYTRQDITSGNVTASYDTTAFEATYAINLTKPRGSTNRSYFRAYTGTDQTYYNVTRNDYDCWNNSASRIELKFQSTCTQTGSGPYTLNSAGKLYCLNGNTSLGYGGWNLIYLSSETVTNLSYGSPSVNNVYSTIYDDDYTTASQGAFYSAPGPDPNGITDQDFYSTNISSRLYEVDVVWYRYPSNAWMEIGFVNSSRDWNYTGEFNTTSKSADLSGKLNAFLSTCTADSDGYCYAPVYLYSEGGNITVNNISINYTLPYDTVYQINETTIESYLNTKGTNFTNITLNISSSTQGIIQISNLSYEYKGGNRTYTITAHNSSNGSTVYLNVTVYYSGWNHSLPRNTQYIEFMPTKGPTQKNVSAYSQNIVRPILNITARNYGGKDYDMYLAMTNVNPSCANYSYAAVSNITSKTQILGNTTWYTLQENVSILENYGTWLYADYDCNITSWRLEQPTFYLRACAKGVLCSTEVS